jgi:uncharacterized membrane protein
MTLRKAGHLLIAAGVMVWVVFAVAWLAGADPDAGGFLPFHLLGVIPGAVMARWPRRAVAED